MKLLLQLFGVGPAMIFDLARLPMSPVVGPALGHEIALMKLMKEDEFSFLRA
jgi:hypothetical protein